MRAARAGLVLALLGVLMVTGVVAATNFGGPRDAGVHCDTTPSSQCVANNASHTVYFEYATSALRDATLWAMTNYNNVAPPIDMAEVFPPATDRDVTVRGDYVGYTGWWAATMCATNASYGGAESPLPGTRWCRPQILQFNRTYEASKYPTTTNKRAVACHELGHTVGLQHTTSTTSCMRSGNQTVTTTNSHDRAHIADYY